MFHLPKKATWIFVVLLLLSFVLYYPAKILADEPGDVFNPPLEKMIQNEVSIREDEAQDGNLRVYNRRVNQGNLVATFGNLTCMVMFCEGLGNQPAALENVTKMMGLMYQNPPASGIYYAYDLLDNAGLAKPVYAQGIGFSGLSALLPLWKVTRNISYTILIIVMIAIGFMIIFRMKIDPKTVISLQAALPKIVVTLLLITFSYPIVGFLVDLMYVVMAISISIVAQGIEQADRTGEFQTYFMTATSWQLFWTIMSGGFSSWNDFFIPNFFVHGTAGIGTGVAGVFKFLGTKWASKLILGIFSPDIIFGLILVLGLLFTFIRLLVILLNSYIQLLIGLILAPLQLLVEAIPGRSAFSGWILNIIANLVVFPTTVVILMFAQYLTALDVKTNLLTPPLTWVPGEGAFQAFLGLMLIFICPTLVVTVKKLFHPKSMLPITAGTMFAPLTGGAQTMMGGASQFYYFQQTAASIPGLKNLFPAKHP